MYSIRLSTFSIGCLFEFHPDLNNTPLGAITVRIYYNSDAHSEIGGPFFIGAITSQDCWNRRIEPAKCYQDYLLLNTVEQYKKELDSALKILQKRGRSISVSELHEI